MNKYKLGIVMSWLFIFGLIGYVLFVILGALHGGLPPIEPYSSFISIVTLLSMPIMVLLWVAIHEAIPAERKLFSLGSLIFIAIFATLTSINRYNALTVVPQAQSLGMTQGLEWFMPYGWPSIMAAMEVEAWGFYLGFAMIVLAFAFTGGKLEKGISITLIICGLLCLVSVVGQFLNNALMIMIGMSAWGPGLSLLAILWLIWFKRKAKA